MSIWVLVAAYLAIFVLLQVAVYRYVRGDDEESSPPWGQVPEAEVGPRRDRGINAEWSDERAPELDREDAHADVEGTTRRCPTCGARNASEQVFVFCRQCAGPLGR